MQLHTIFVAGHYRIDPAARELWLDDALVALPPKSFECLAYLLEHRDRAVGRDELISAVWGRVDVSDALLSQTLLRTRRALGDTGNEQTVIRTVPRFGYRWIAPVEIRSADAIEAAAAPATENRAHTVEAAGLPQQPAREAPASPSVVQDPSAREPEQSVARERRPGYGFHRGLVAFLFVMLTVAGIAMWRGPMHERNLSSNPTPTAADLWVVFPVIVHGEAGDAAWIRLGVMDYIASRLRTEAGLSVVPSAQVISQLAETSSADPTQASVRLRQTTGAERLVRVDARPTLNGWHLILFVDGSNSSREIEAAAPSALEAAARVTNVLLGDLGVTPRKGPATMADPLQEQLQRIDAALLGGDLALARALVTGAPEAARHTAAFRVRAGQTAFRAGQVDEAATIFEDILHNSAVPAPIDHANALMGLGAVAVRRRDFLDGERRYAEALASLGNDGPTDLVGNAYNGRGVCRAARGEVDLALADFGRARIALERAGDQLTAANVDTNLDILESNRQHPAQAIVAFDRAVSTFDRFGVHDNLAAALVGRLRAELDLLDVPRAQADAMRLGTLERDLENATLRANLRLAQASVAMATGKLELVATLLAEPSAGNFDDTPLRIRLALSRKNPAKAWELARSGFAQRKSIDTPYLRWLAVAAITYQVVDEAARLLDSLTHDESDTLDAQLAHALPASRSDPEKARRFFANAMVKADASGVPELRVGAGTLFAEHLIRSGHLDEATATVGALAHYAQQDFRVAQAMVSLFSALHDTRQLEKSIQQRNALAGERPLDLPVY